MTRPDPHIALIYHYDLARALAGEVVDWHAIPVNVDAGREGGDLCRAAADFAKRRDLFAMPAPSHKTEEPCDELTSTPTSSTTTGQRSNGASASATATTTSTSSLPTSSSNSIGLSTNSTTSESCDPSAVPATPTAVEQQAADPEPSTASTAVPGPAVNVRRVQGFIHHTPDPYRAAAREKLRARIKGLVDQGHEHLLRRYWPEDVPTLKHDGHSDAQLQLILACVRRVEAEVGAGWHPDDGPPPHVNTDPRASVEYPAAAAAAPDEGRPVSGRDVKILEDEFSFLDVAAHDLVNQITKEANAAGRTLSLSVAPKLRRWSIARAVIAWAASGRTVDDMWFAASNLATFEQCRDPSATLGGLISQFTIEQADRLYQAAGQ